jgi:hypothetical protein
MVVADGMLSLVVLTNPDDGGTGSIWYVGPYTMSGSTLNLSMPCADGGDTGGALSTPHHRRR